METIRRQTKECADKLLPHAIEAGTAELFEGCIDMVVVLANALNCNQARNTGSPGNGILFEITGRSNPGQFTLFARRKKTGAGVVALAISDAAIGTRASELLALVHDLCRDPGVAVVEEGKNRWPAIGFKTVAAGKQIIQAVSTFILDKPLNIQPILKVRDSFADLVDPGDDPAFRAYVATLSETEREIIIKARVGQGPFRDGLIDRWAGCSVTGCGLTEVLIASHIKPWSKCETPIERLGAANGLLLTPNLDKLFDRGLISFDDNFRIIFSRGLKDGFAQMLNVDKHMRLKSSKYTDMRPFLEWHRQHVFRS